MALTLWADFYDSILPDVQGVTPPVVDFNLRQICQEFCEESSIHTAEVTAIDVVADTATYTLTSTVTGTEAYKIKAAWFDDVPLSMAPIDVLNNAQEYWPDTEATDAYAYTQKQPDQIILYPKPDTALVGGLRVELILRPTIASTGLTDWIATRYMRQIACGVKGRLMAQPNKPWSSPEFSTYYTSLYESAKTKAAFEAQRSLTRAALSVQMRPAVR